MHLGHTKIKAKSYSHWLSRLLPCRLDDNEKAILIPLIKKGDKDAINRMIEGHTGLIAQVVGRYAWQQPRKTDDMLSVGWLALTEAVIKFSKGEINHDNITGYILTRAHGAIHNFIVEDQTVKPSRDTFSKIIRHHIDDIEETIEHEFEQPDYLIEEIGLNNVEKIIAIMALEGYTNIEIGKKLNYSKAYIGRLRLVVGQKILRKLQ